jgi:xanthine dehydrogenase large subunit
MKNIDSTGHVTGRSVFVDDMPLIRGTLYAVAVASSVAHGKIRKIELESARALDGVVAILTTKDIPGENQVGGVIPDETLLSDGEIHFIGQPIALVIATSERIARKAGNLVKIDYEELTPITDPRIAKEKGLLLFPPRTFKAGNTDSAWKACDHVFEGTVDSGSQEHLYLETQGAYAVPLEPGNIKVHSATQSPTVVQKTIANILGIAMNRVEVDVQRLGGAFGGKEDQATAWACLAALGAYRLQKPVKLVLSRHDDMYMTGKRHPYSSDFKIGLSKDLKILAWEVTYYQNGGAATDLSMPIMERTLFHTTNSYFIPNVTATAHSCKTNLPPNTAFRGFGAPQAMFVMECAISKAAAELGISERMIQERNLLKENDTFHYGQVAQHANATLCWKEVCTDFQIEEKEKEIAHFNQGSTIFRKGMALIPVCFGISFTKTNLNQARSLVHIYQDGSVGISTGAVEMGQGVNTKMKQVAAHCFSIDPSRIRLETTNTTRVANTSATAASSGADLNGKAVQQACMELLVRLKETAARMLKFDPAMVEFKDEQILPKGGSISITWEELIRTAYLERVNLSQAGHYATPEIYFGKDTHKGHPFAYHVYGTAVITVTVDCLRGRYHVDNVQIVHDFGNSINSVIDTGQVEGAVVQGIGWMTMEEVKYNEKGQLLSNSLSTYKVPDIYSVPKIIEIKALQTEGPELAILRSKAVGEPPFNYGIGVYFALQNAILAFNSSAKLPFDAPLTPEKVLMALYS